MCSQFKAPKRYYNQNSSPLPSFCLPLNFEQGGSPVGGPMGGLIPGGGAIRPGAGVAGPAGVDGVPCLGESWVTAPAVLGEAATAAATTGPLPWTHYLLGWPPNPSDRTCSSSRSLGNWNTSWYTSVSCLANPRASCSSSQVVPKQCQYIWGFTLHSHRNQVLYVATPDSKLAFLHALAALHSLTWSPWSHPCHRGSSSHVCRKP